MTSPPVIQKMRQELRDNIDFHTKETEKRYFKESIKAYGVKTAQVIKIAKKYFAESSGLDKSEVFKLCDELWQSGYMEESFIACDWAYGMKKVYTPDDFQIFEKWVTVYVSNWASCDTLCNHTVGTFVALYPHYVEELKKWAKSKNRWVRRASAVTLIIPARNGKFLTDIFEIADILLSDKDDLVQKGYGWMLKAASQAHQKQVFDYVMKRKASMPRTALRYAIEKMPEKLRQLAMQK